MMQLKTRLESPGLREETAVRYLKGVGPKMAGKLAGLGIGTVGDLVRYYPRDWEDRRIRKKIRQVRTEEKIALFGTIRRFHFTETLRGFAIAEIVLEDDTGTLPCKWIRRRSFKYDILQTFKREFETGAGIA